MCLADTVANYTNMQKEKRDHITSHGSDTGEDQTSEPNVLGGCNDIMQLIKTTPYYGLEYIKTMSKTATIR